MIHIEKHLNTTIYFVGEYEILQINYPPSIYRYKNKKLHCETGPAIVYEAYKIDSMSTNGSIIKINQPGTSQYWLYGQQVFPSSIKELKSMVKLKAFL